MASISPTTIQHIQQMGTATEKLQHSLQNIPQAAGEQHKKDRNISDELKRTTVQSAEHTNQSNTVHRDGKRRRQDKKKKDPAQPIVSKNEQGRTINLIV